MSNVVSMERPCEYLVRRAAAARHKGNYDGAMTLLSKAKDQFGLREEIEIEMARIYDEMECEEEAARAYLRVVRLNGEHRAEALFQLALSAMQRTDMTRALSYYELFLASDRRGIAPEYAELFGVQLRKEAERQPAPSRKERARALVRRGVERMHAGKAAAARRTFSHALALRESAQIHTLLACCALLEGDAQRALQHGEKAHALSPGRVQALLVLADAHALAGEERKALRALYLAAMRSRDLDDYLATALESAKRGQDTLTLRLTHQLLKLEPYHTRAMMLRACALANLGRWKEASRLFGRVCVLMPENTVSETFYKLCREEKSVEERLSLGIEVPYEEGVARAAQLVAALYVPPEELRSDKDRERMLCRIAGWAFRSQLAVGQVAYAALLVMMIMGGEMADAVLQDALTDPQVDDAFKCKILQGLAAREGVRPYPVDIGGRLVHLAAGGVVERPCSDEICRDVAQQAADALLPRYKDAPKKLLDLWLKYLERYGAPGKKNTAVCAAALEYAYHVKSGRKVRISMIARRNGVSRRLCAFYARRIVAVRCEETDE